MSQDVADDRERHHLGDHDAHDALGHREDRHGIVDLAAPGSEGDTGEQWPQHQRGHSINAVTGTVRAISADHEPRWRASPFIRLAVI